MQVLFFIDDVLSRNFGSPLELAAHHLRAGDRVDFVVCRGSLPACPSNSRHDELACRLCRSRLDSALVAPALCGVRVHELVLEDADLALDSVTFASIEELKGYAVDGEDLGIEAASSVVTVLRDPRPDLAAESALVESNLRTAVSVYRWFVRSLPRLGPDRVYVLNGRRSSQMPVVRAVRKYGCELATYEIGHDARKYVLVPGTYFHDLARKKSDMAQYWNAEPDANRRLRLADTFFRERRFGSGKFILEAKYKDTQSRGRVPADFSPADRNLVVFNSSEFEFTAVQGYENPVYANQMIGLDAILSDPRLSPDLRVWLRVHPHLAGLRNSQTEAIARLDPARIRVIGPEEPVDTYALMEASEKVLTFGSTVSIEAAYAGIPSILVGREVFEDGGSCYTPATHDELMELINDPHLNPLPRDGALMYGHFMVARDVVYKEWDPVSKLLARHPVQSSAPLRIAARVLWSSPISYLKARLRKQVATA